MCFLPTCRVNIEEFLYNITLDNRLFDYFGNILLGNMLVEYLFWMYNNQRATLAKTVAAGKP